jgi:hypothetical protein
MSDWLFTVRWIVPQMIVKGTVHSLQQRIRSLASLAEVLQHEFMYTASTCTLSMS